MRKLGTVGLLALSLASSPVVRAAPKPALVLEPSSKWTIDYSPENCRLLRSFGSGNDSVTLILSAHQPDTSPLITVTGNVFSRIESRIMVSAGYSPGAPPQQIFASVANIGPSNVRALRLGGRDWTKLPNASLSTAVFEFSMEGAQFGLIKLQIGPINGAMAAMTKCTDALVQAWGYDPVEQGRLSRRPTPIGGQGNWIRLQDYPKDLLERRQTGVVWFRLAIDENGKPQNCVVQEETNQQVFGNISCQLVMQRARFDPALDDTGKKIKSFFVTAVRWQPD